MTPLHIAAGEGYRYTVENLLHNGADIHIKDKQGVNVHDYTPDHAV